MIPIETEHLITLAEAAALLPGVNGRPVHYNTVHRWATAGVRGVRLETAYAGGRRYTSREAVQRFIDQLTAKRAGQAEIVPPRLPRRSKPQVRRRLEQHGLSY